MVRYIRIILIFSILLAVAGSCGCKKEADVDPRVPVRLNEVLTNELSDTTDLAKLDAKIRRYMRQWQMHGAQLSVMRNDSLLYSKGYGYADEENGEAMEPYHILRVASVSKLVTATGIMLLQEHGRLSLKDTVFGERGILCDTALTVSIRDKNYYKITVEDLLRHKGGFTQRAGDPMFSTRTVMMQNRLDEAPDAETLVRCVTKRRLGFRPGTSQSYSNFGYLLLSMIIEEVTGEEYEKWIRKNVLEPAGCYGFQMANNYYKQKHKGESRYYVPSNEPLVEEYNNSGRQVIRCYGGNDIHALSGAGAWVASSAELARFVASIDGHPSVPDILSQESVDAMTEYIDKKTYGIGWNDIGPELGWVRTGTFSGTTALIKYYPDGECWIFVSNTSTWKGPGHARYTSALFSELRREYGHLFPKRDFFWE